MNHIQSKYKKSLIGILISQFFGSFNDNAWKIILFTLALRIGFFASSDSHSDQQISQIAATASLVIFLLPMLLFSIVGGMLCDRISKSRMICYTKGLEVLLMGLAALSLWAFPHQLIVPFVLLAFMGAQSALFSPAKYGALPELFPETFLAKGNGFIEVMSMMGIIAGTGVGPMLLGFDSEGLFPEKTYCAAVILAICALFGFLSTFLLPSLPVAAEKPRFSSNVVRAAWKAISQSRPLYLSIMGMMFFWTLVSLLGQNILVYAQMLVAELEKGEIWLGIPPAVFGIGIAVGAYFGGRICADSIDYGLMPLGSIGFCLSAVLLGILTTEMMGTLILLSLMGISTGMIIVPLNAITQIHAPAQQRGSVIAFGNMISIIGMLAGSLTAMGMAYFGTSIKNTLLLSAILVVAGMIWSVRLLPQSLVRLVFILMTRTFYRFDILGKENIPKTGGALLIANHMSLLDAFFILATVQRPIRFIMNTEIYEKWWIYPFAKLLDVIPVSRTRPPQEIFKALRAAGNYMDSGELICIFPEGTVSRTGMMQPFQRGAEILMRHKKCPVVPIFLDQVWGSVFSLKKGSYYAKTSKRFPYQVSLVFGSHLLAETQAHEMQQAIRHLGAQAWIARQERAIPIHHSVIYLVRRSPFNGALVDAEGNKLSRLQTLTSAVVLARKLYRSLAKEQNVGVLLPPTIGGVLVNLAITLSGKTVVNLNFTTGRAQLESAIEQSELKTVLTSRQFLTHLKWDLPKHLNVIYVEDIKPQITSKEKIIGLFIALFAPIRFLERYCGAKKKITPQDLLTIIFTSGSTGEPKGVMLTHFNVDSNVEGVAQITPAARRNNRLLHTLPFFHSFGYMTMWLGLKSKIKLVLHPNPLDTKVVGDLILKHRVSIIFTTPSFLRAYSKRIAPDYLGSVKCLLTGAEKLSAALCDEIQEKYGVHPIEGYGATECSPVIATNTLDVRYPGVYQAGSKRGTVGQPLPGVYVKVVDPETFEELPIGWEGMLLVKGPNVMAGYLNRADLTAEVMHGEYYITGDIAAIDEEGYIRITDRLSRFSKIGGEMVPHGKVEEALHELYGAQEQLFAVTALPHPKKGEQLVVLHTCTLEEMGPLLDKMMQNGLPALFIPNKKNCIQVASLPVLGSGKIDLKALKTLAAQSIN